VSCTEKAPKVATVLEVVPKNPKLLQTQQEDAQALGSLEDRHT
jgi:hypothetical protein